MRSVIIHGIKVTEQSPRFGRPECDLWGVTRANCRFWKGKLLDWTAWVDVHPLVDTLKFPGIPVRRPDAWKWYSEQDGTRPIYLMHPDDHPQGADRALAAQRFASIPGATRFPIREIQAFFPLNGEPNRWFVEQTGMMLAFARMQGYERVILNGVGTMTTADYQVAHRSILYWIAFLRGAAWAEGRDFAVEIEGRSTFRTPSQIYAFEKFNYEELERARQEIRARGDLDDLISKADRNLAEQRRGRPRKFNIPAPDEAFA